VLVVAVALFIELVLVVEGDRVGFVFFGFGNCASNLAFSAAKPGVAGDGELSISGALVTDWQPASTSAAPSAMSLRLVCN
jgi:hypothetical protein